MSAKEFERFRVTSTATLIQPKTQAAQILNTDVQLLNLYTLNLPEVAGVEGSRSQDRMSMF